MSSLIVDQGAGPQSGDLLAKPIRERIRQARDHRKQFEPTWHSNLAFAAGKYDLEWSRVQRQLVMPQSLRGKELYSADVITEYRTSALGELGSDDDRPELLVRRDDSASDDYQKQVNRAVSFGWDYEWQGDYALDEVDGLTLDLGTAAIRCRWEPDYGPTVADSVPFQNGKPILDTEQARQLFEDGPTDDVTMQSVKQGRICWDVLSAFNVLVPPGIPRERYFPWEGIVRPVLLSKVKAEFGEAAADLKEDTDIGSVYGWDTGSAGNRPDASSYTAGMGSRARLRDHVWLFTYFEQPTPPYPYGRTVNLAGNELEPLRFTNQLPYHAPDGSWRSGIAYFHWWRVTGRFWSRGLVEVMKDGQRLVNRRRRQTTEIIDRGMPFVIVQKDSAALNRKGTPVEFIEVDRQEAPPVVNQGVPPGPWMQADVEAIREDLDHATGIKGVRLGENPQNVTTYSQLALVNENDQGKRQTIVAGRKQAIARLVEDSVYDIRTYWGPQRNIQLAGDADRIDAAVFDATKIPPFYIVKVAKGGTQPRSQAAELAKIESIWRAAVETGVAAQPGTAERWARWYAASLNAGSALELPQLESDSQTKVAEFENFLMVEQGKQPAPAEYDLLAVHMPIHRQAQDQARAAGDDATDQLLQQHIETSIQMAAAARKAWRVPDPTDLQDVGSDVALDEDQCLRENEMLMQGVPLNPEALQQAQASLDQGIDPDTGQPLTSTDPASLRAILLHASLKPTLVENLQLHLDRHGKVIKSSAFEHMPPDVRARFLNHFDQTRDLWLSIPMLPEKVDAPRVSLQLRESVGPSTVAGVLRRAGVPEADAQTLGSEEPMENQVRRDDPPPGPDAPQPPQDHGPRPPL